MSLTPETAPLIVSFGHTARSGKGECAQTIYRKHSREHGGEYDIAIFSFAKALRDEIHQAMFDQWTLDHPHQHTNPSIQMQMEHLCKWAGVPYDPDAKIDELNPFTKQRALQQWWGLEYRRNQDPFWWVKKLEEAIEARHPQVALVDDLRFPNEFFFIDFLGGCKVRVERPGYEGLTEEQRAHPSEHALDGFEFDFDIVAPDGHLEDLRSQALALFDKVIAKHNAAEFIDLAAQISAQPFVAVPSTL